MYISGWSVGWSVVNGGHTAVSCSRTDSGPRSHAACSSAERLFSRWLRNAFHCRRSSALTVM